MRTLFIIAALSAAVATGHAQALYGYFSYDNVLHSMEAYADAMQQIEQLKSQYDAETKRVEDEFNAKFEDFLDDRRDLDDVILHKRQAELQDLMEKNIAFKKEAGRLLRSAENDAIAPLRESIDQALQALGQERGYHFIINTDAHALPYINEATGDDIEAELVDRLNAGK